MDDAGRTLVDRFEIVADRLLARDVREGAEDGGEEARRFGFDGGGEANAPVTRLRVDVDEAAVDLAAGGAVQERVDDGEERRVGEPRSVDQFSILGLAEGDLAGQGTPSDAGPGRPGLLTFVEES